MATISFWRYLLNLIYWLLGHVAVELNLRVTKRGLLIHVWRDPMAKLGDVFTATISPKNAAGEFAPVTAVKFAEDAGAYSVVQSADGLSAVLTAVKGGKGLSVIVIATSKAGVTLRESAILPDVEAPDEEAVALNLSVA